MKWIAKWFLAAWLVVALVGTASADLQKVLESYLIGDYATTLAELTPLAEAGNVDAQALLGTMYADSIGVEQDYAEAAKWYHLAAEAGNDSAQYNLGLLYEDGKGVEQDYAEAVKWYRLAAEAGHAKSQNNLGLMYENGKGALQDYRFAYMWYEISAAQEFERAKGNRAALTKRMTPLQIAEAQLMARRCLAQNYKGCK